MSKKSRANRKPVPFRQIRNILIENVVNIDQSYCYRLPDNQFDVFFKAHANCLRNSVNFTIHNNRVIVNIRYAKSKKAYTVIGYYKSFCQLDDIIDKTIMDISP